MNGIFNLGLIMLLQGSCVLYSMHTPVKTCKNRYCPSGRTRPLPCPYPYPLKRAVGVELPVIPYRENIVDIFWEAAANGRWDETVSRNFLRVRNVVERVCKERSIGRSSLLHYAVSGRNVRAVRDVLKVISQCRPDQRYKFLMAVDLENETALDLAAELTKAGTSSEEIFYMLLRFKSDIEAAQEKIQVFEEMLRREALERRREADRSSQQAKTLAEEVTAFFESTLESIFK